MSKVLLIALLAGCSDAIEVDPRDDTAPVVPDTECPVITHTPVSETQAFRSDVLITAEVTDESRITFVTLHYKNDTAGSKDWKKVNMAVVEGAYSGTIKGTDHSGSGMDYYIEASDSAQNTCYSPEEGAQDPYHFRIAEK